MTKKKSIEIVGRGTEELWCQLDREEVESRAAELAAQHGRLSNHTEHEADVKAQLKSERTRLEADISRLAMCVRNKKENRHIEVEYHHDYDEKRVRVVRVDTGEVVRERGMNPAEFQLSIPTVPLPEELGR